MQENEHQIDLNAEIDALLSHSPCPLLPCSTEYFAERLRVTDPIGWVRQVLEDEMRKEDFCGLIAGQESETAIIQWAADLIRKAGVERLETLHGQRLFGLLKRKYKEDAEDIYQECFQSLSSKDGFQSFLKRKVPADSPNPSYSSLKLEARNKTRRLYERKKAHVGVTEEDKLVASQTSPTRPVRRDERSVRLHAALDELDPVTAKIVQMRMKGKSFGEIAVEMGMKEGAAKERYRRGMKRLAKILRADPEFDPPTGCTDDRADGDEA